MPRKDNIVFLKMDFLMSSASVLFQYLIIESLNFLNQPSIKNSVKDLTGFITCLFGMIEIYYFCKFFKAKEKTTLNFISKISLILSPFVTRQGIFLMTTFTTLFSLQFNGFFGQNTIFALNPWYPKHIASIAAVLFALPALYAKLTPSKFNFLKNETLNNRVIFFLLFNTLSSRPVLHLANQLALLFKDLIT